MRNNAIGILSGMLLASSITTVAVSSEAAVIPNANAAELTLHRIEKLVILNKIDVAFQNHFKGLKLVINKYVG